MADDVGKAELALGIAPVKLVRGDAGDHSQRALADLFVVIKKLAGTGDFHDSNAYCICWILCRNVLLLNFFSPAAVRRPSSAMQSLSMAVKLKQALPCMRFFNAGDMPSSSSGQP